MHESGGKGEYVVSSNADRPPLLHIPAIMRRRLTPLGRMALYAGYLADPEQTAHIRVYCSRHGDLSRTINLLDTLADSQTVSPADFSMSVHNAIGALEGIATKNKCDYTAISAAEHTFLAGLIEACGYLQSGTKRVLVVIYDEKPPILYQSYVTDPEFTYAFALLLTKAQTAAPYYTLTFQHNENPTSSGADLDLVHFFSTAQRQLTTAQWELEHHVS